MIIEGWQAWAQGNHDLLPANAMMVLRCARHHERQHVLISKLVGLSMASFAYDALRDALAESHDPGALASRSSSGLAVADPTPPGVSRQFRCEQKFFWDTCQRVFLPGREPGSWQVYGPAYRALTETTHQSGASAVPAVTEAEIEKLAEIGFDETVRVLDRHFAEMVAWCEARYSAAPHHGEEIERATRNIDNPLIRRLLPSLIRTRLLCERRDAHRRATHLVYHLFAHHAKTGGFPSSLRRLDAPDLEQLRIDPFSGRDFMYKRVSKGFTLYSLADNLEDDRGQHDPKWKTGDYVFWPVQR